MYLYQTKPFRMKRLVLILSSIAALFATACEQAEKPTELKPRLVVCTDIGPGAVEPDDMESAVRLMCYADRFEIEAIITTVGWNCDPYPTEWAEYLDTVITAYSADVQNLMKRSGQTEFMSLEEENGQQHLGYWPSAEYIRGRAMMGSQRAGIGVIGEGNDTPGSEFLIQLADEADSRPIWVTSWGSSNTFAQAVWKVQQTRTPKELKEFLNKFRVYTITDQDMVYAMRMDRAYSSHQWLRREFQDDLLFIWDEGTWTEQCDLGKRAWDTISEKIQGNATLGSVYPTYLWGVEGDTPSYLHLMPNGLNDPDDPTQVSWGGIHRFGICPDRETYAWTSWQQPLFKNTVAYKDSFYPDELNDFIARIEWARDGEGNRNPEIVVNGDWSYKPLVIELETDDTVVLDAKASSDPDGDSLTFRWWQQTDADAMILTPFGSETLQPELPIEGASSPVATITVPDRPGARYDIICEVHDNGPHNLVSYKRIILNVGD